MKVIKLSDVKKFISKLKNIGVTIERRSDIEHSYYKPRQKKVVITRKRAKDIPYITLVWLYHEGGHALTDLQTLKHSANLNILDRLHRYKNNPKYSKVVGGLLELQASPENIETMTSAKLKVKKAFRLLRKQLFIEKLANSQALKHIPDSFIDTYNRYASRAYAAYRQKFTKHKYYQEFITSSALDKAIEKHYF